MGVYISSDGTEKDTSTLNSFNLVNGLIKHAQGAIDPESNPEVASQNVEALKAELLERLDTRPLTEQPEDITPVMVGAVAMPNGEIICLGKTIGRFGEMLDAPIIKKR